MNLSELQKSEIAKWIEEGAKLSQIQARLASELGLSLTYMEVRFLVDDLKLVPKDPEPSKTPEPLPGKAVLATKPVPEDEVEVLPPLPAAGGSGLSVTVDQIARPGALVSGKVTFTDGQKAGWTLDQMGRLGLVADQKGYRPSQSDLEQFQAALQNELGKLGF